MAESDNREEFSDFTFKVNGIEIENKQQKLLAEEILRLAKQKQAFPGKPEDYILEGAKGRYKLDDPVDLQEDNQFITLPNAATPVA